MGSLVQKLLHDEANVYYDQEWFAYQLMTIFEADDDDDNDDDGDYDYAPAA
ncbi:hypothetical protein LR48_Vigan01g263700 [Vigna angularis]|uniref:Uncharacterized protein n=2 Tax=Phaseolus angularis TaxID=3914 RepID=A0A0L9TRG5_PHAAN|nr:hypothetical protein LR48_Vigan01g263700 [Vigna angularis]